MVFNVMCFAPVKSHTVQVSLSIPIARMYLLKKKKKKTEREREREIPSTQLTLGFFGQ